MVGERKGRGRDAEGWDALTSPPLVTPGPPAEAPVLQAVARWTGHCSCRRLHSSRRLRSPAQLRVLRRKVLSSSLKASWFMGR